MYEDADSAQRKISDPARTLQPSSRRCYERTRTVTRGAAVAWSPVSSPAPPSLPATLAASTRDDSAVRVLDAVEVAPPSPGSSDSRARPGLRTCPGNGSCSSPRPAPPGRGSADRRVRGVTGRVQPAEDLERVHAGVRPVSLAVDCDRRQEADRGRCRRSRGKATDQRASGRQEPPVGERTGRVVRSEVRNLAPPGQWRSRDRARAGQDGVYRTPTRVSLTGLGEGGFEGLHGTQPTACCTSPAPSNASSTRSIGRESLRRRSTSEAHEYGISGHWCSPRAPTGQTAQGFRVCTSPTRAAAGGKVASSNCRSHRVPGSRRRSQGRWPRRSTPRVFRRRRPTRQESRTWQTATRCSSATPRWRRCRSTAARTCTS